MPSPDIHLWAARRETELWRLTTVLWAVHPDGSRIRLNSGHVIARSPSGRRHHALRKPTVPFAETHRSLPFLRLCSKPPESEPICNCS